MKGEKGGRRPGKGKRKPCPDFYIGSARKRLEKKTNLSKERLEEEGESQEGVVKGGEKLRDPVDGRERE